MKLGLTSEGSLKIKSLGRKGQHPKEVGDDVAAGLMMGTQLDTQSKRRRGAEKR